MCKGRVFQPHGGSGNRHNSGHSRRNSRKKPTRRAPHNSTPTPGSVDPLARGRLITGGDRDFNRVNPANYTNERDYFRAVQHDVNSQGPETVRSGVIGNQVHQNWNTYHQNALTNIQKQIADAEKTTSNLVSQRKKPTKTTRTSRSSTTTRSQPRIQPQQKPQQKPSKYSLGAPRFANQDPNWNTNPATDLTTLARNLGPLRKGEAYAFYEEHKYDSPEINKALSKWKKINLSKDNLTNYSAGYSWTGRSLTDLKPLVDSAKQSYQSVLDEATKAADFQIAQEKANALLRGLKYAPRTDDREGRIQYELNKRWTPDKQEQLKNLFAETGTPEGFEQALAPQSPGVDVTQGLRHRRLGNPNPGVANPDSLNYSQFVQKAHQEEAFKKVHGVQREDVKKKLQPGTRMHGFHGKKAAGLVDQGNTLLFRYPLDLGSAQSILGG